MPNTPFALWQSRVGLTRAAEASVALGLKRRSIERLRRGDQEPHPSTRRLMDLLEANPALITADRGDG